MSLPSTSWRHSRGSSSSTRSWAMRSQSRQSERGSLRRLALNSGSASRFSRSMTRPMKSRDCSSPIWVAIAVGPICGASSTCSLSRIRSWRGSNMICAVARYSGTTRSPRARPMTAPRTVIRMISHLRRNSAPIRRPSWTVSSSGCRERSEPGAPISRGPPAGKAAGPPRRPTCWIMVEPSVETILGDPAAAPEARSKRVRRRHGRTHRRLDGRKRPVEAEILDRPLATGRREILGRADDRSAGARSSRRARPGRPGAISTPL